MAVSLFCITPLGRQASSFVPRLCGGEKEKKERGRSFVACVAVSLKVCCFVLRPWGGKLVVCITPVGRQACSFVLRPFGGKFVALLPVWRQARRFRCLWGSKLVVFCVTPVWRQDCSFSPVWLSACVFVLSLWGCTCSFMPVRWPA